MNDQPTVPSQPTPGIPPSPIVQPKQSMSGCLKVFLWVAGFLAFIFLIIAILVWQSISWLKNAPESKIATYPALKMSPGEEEDINRVIAAIEQAKARDGLCEEYITANVFNGLLEKILEGDRAKGKKDVPLFLRAALAEDNKLELKVTQPMKDGEKAGDGSPLYVNVEVVFQLEIVDGELRQANVDKLVLRGREAPFLSRVVVNQVVKGIKAESQQNKNSKDNKLAAIKLLRRDGERIHIILDGKKLREQEQEQDAEQKQQPTDKKKPEPEKPGAF
jgi:hypothetical protein